EGAHVAAEANGRLVAGPARWKSVRYGCRSREHGDARAIGPFRRQPGESTEQYAEPRRIDTGVQLEMTDALIAWNVLRDLDSRQTRQPFTSQCLLCRRNPLERLRQQLASGRRIAQFVRSFAKEPQPSIACVKSSAHPIPVFRRSDNL